MLERRELVRVTVASADARQRVIYLTAAGKQLRDRLMTVALDRERRLLSVFSAEEVETLSNLLQRLRVHIPTVRTPKSVPFVRRTSRSAKSRCQRAGTRPARRAKA